MKQYSQEYKSQILKEIEEVGNIPWFARSMKSSELL